MTNKILNYNNFANMKIFNFKQSNMHIFSEEPVVQFKDNSFIQ